MSEGKAANYDETAATKIEGSVKNVFQALKEQGKEFTFGDDTRTVWSKAHEIEKKSEDFYREKAKEVSEDQMHDGLDTIQKLTDTYVGKIEEVLQAGIPAHQVYMDII